MDGPSGATDHGCEMTVLPLVGRERELRVLDDLVGASANAATRLWCVVRAASGIGPAGGGSTRAREYELDIQR